MPNTSAVFGYALAGIAIFGLIGLVLTVLYIVALVKIITKAGYSAWWILLMFLPVLTWIITSAIVYFDASSQPTSTALTTFNTSFNASLFIWAWVADGIAYLVPVVFFFVFAFSEWPVQKEVKRLRIGATNVSASPAQSPAVADHPILVEPQPNQYPQSPGPAHSFQSESSTPTPTAISKAQSDQLTCPYGHVVQPEWDYCMFCATPTPLKQSVGTLAQAPEPELLQPTCPNGHVVQPEWNYCKFSATPTPLKQSVGTLAQAPEPELLQPTCPNGHVVQPEWNYCKFCATPTPLK